MARELRDIKALLERCEVNDSYGVDGSDFKVCLICNNDSGAGVLRKTDWHAKGCPVPRLKLKYVKRGKHG